MNDDLEIPWLSIILVCVAIGLAVFVLHAMGYVTFTAWAPRFEDARRDTFEHSRSFVRGKQQHLLRLYGEWSQADPAHRKALCSIAAVEASELEPRDLPTTLASWECVK